MMSIDNWKRIQKKIVEICRIIKTQFVINKYRIGLDTISLLILIRYYYYSMSKCLIKINREYTITKQIVISKTTVTFFLILSYFALIFNLNSF